MKSTIIFALITSIITIACCEERRERKFRPLEPKRVFDKEQPGKIESIEVDLPRHDVERVYYGPDSALFPQSEVVDLPALPQRWPKIKFD